VLPKLVWMLQALCIQVRLIRTRNDILVTKKINVQSRSNTENSMTGVEEAW